MSATGTKSRSGSYGSFGYSAGLMATCELLTISSSCPSGGAFFTLSMARNPLAPGLGSTITRSPQALDNLSASTCMKTVGPALEENGTWIFTTLDGNACAIAADEITHIAAEASRHTAIPFAR